MDIREGYKERLETPGTKGPWGTLLVPATWVGCPAWRVQLDDQSIGHVYSNKGLYGWRARGWRFCTLDGRGYGEVVTRNAAIAALLQLRGVSWKKRI